MPRSPSARKPNIVKSGAYTFFAGARSDAFFFDFDGIKNLFDTKGGRNFTAPHLGGKSPWTGVDSNTEANVFSTVMELPTSELGANPVIHIWGRCSVRRDGKLLHVDRAGHPSVSSFFNTDETKEEYNASEPVNDRKRWTDQFVHLMGHTGNYTREEAIAAIDVEGLLPDMLSFNPSKPAKYPNGRVFTDDVIDYRLAFLSKGDIPPDGLKPHTDTLKRVSVPRHAASEKELRQICRARARQISFWASQLHPSDERNSCCAIAKPYAIRG